MEHSTGKTLKTPAAGKRPRATRQRRKPDVSQAAAPRRIRIGLETDINRSLGFVRGEIVMAIEADDLKVWDIAAYNRQGRGRNTFVLGRVIAVTPDSLTLRDDEMEWTAPRSELLFLGRVDPEPVGRLDGLTGEQRARLQELRERLDRLATKDELANCTAAFSIEREIYDLTHPPADSDDWSAWEGDSA